MLENKEIWKDCKGYEGKYQVSNMGRIWSVERQRCLTPIANNKGYWMIWIRAKNGKKKCELIHRLVALAFVDNPNKLPVVNHKDCNVNNNNADNLEWCTQKENIQYAASLGHMSHCGTDNPNSKKVAQYDKQGNLIKVWDYIKQASDELGINLSSISNCCTGRYKTSGGFKWMYYDEYKNIV